jgi:NADPH2:quinone reductase
MHAIRLTELGPAENLRYEQVDDPVPAAGQVRIAVAAAGVHLIDTVLRRGDPGPWPTAALPTIPGREVAGTVDDVGADVDRSWIGRRVVAHLGAAGAGYAELAVAPVESLHTVPAGSTDAEAVAMIGTGRTTVAILDLARIVAGDTVVVTSAAGGIGTLAVQAARHARARTVALVGGPGKVGQARSNGADVVADVLEPGWPEDVASALGADGATVVLDGVGGAVGRAAFDLLGAGGRTVMYGFSTGSPTQITSGDLWSRGLTASVLPRPDDLRGLERRALAELAGRRLVPALTCFPLEQAAAAHAALESRATIGKVVLVT